MGIFSKARLKAFSSVQRERRRDPRFEVSGPAEVLAADGGELLGAGLIRDISAGGACIAVDRALEVGRRIRFRCGSGSMPAVIRHCSGFPAGYLVGVEFLRRLNLEGELERTFPALW